MCNVCDLIPWRRFSAGCRLKSLWICTAFYFISQLGAISYLIWIGICIILNDLTSWVGWEALLVAAFGCFAVCLKFYEERDSWNYTRLGLEELYAEEILFQEHENARARVLLENAALQTELLGTFRNQLPVELSLEIFQYSKHIVPSSDFNFSGIRVES